MNVSKTQPPPPSPEPQMPRDVAAHRIAAIQQLYNASAPAEGIHPVTTEAFANDPFGFLIYENSKLSTKLRFAEIEIERLKGPRGTETVPSALYCDPTTELVAIAFMHF